MLHGIKRSGFKLPCPPNLMSSGSIKEVAFRFLSDGQEWHGGLNYFRSLFVALSTATDAGIKPVAFVGARADVASMCFPDNVRVVRSSLLDRKSPLWLLDKLCEKIFGIPWFSNSLIRRQGIDVLSHAGPTGQGVLRNIAWIPDFQHLHLPQFFSTKELRERTKLYQDMIRRSDLIVLSSDSARRDLENFAPSYVAKARVLRFCAVQPEVNWSELLELRSTYGIYGPFFYIPNQLWAHKNHLTAIRALAHIADEWPEISVICSGSLNDYRNPEHFDQLCFEIARFGLDSRFRFLGVIPYKHIAQLMLQSVSVINPSQFEGWSATVEEAKALGVPLILSSIDVHREQCQTGEADFFDTLAPVSLANSLLKRRDVPRPAMTEAEYKAASLLHSVRSKAFAHEFARIVNDLTQLHAN